MPGCRFQNVCISNGTHKAHISFVPLSKRTKSSEIITICTTINMWRLFTSNRFSLYFSNVTFIKCDVFLYLTNHIHWNVTFVILVAVGHWFVINKLWIKSHRSIETSVDLTNRAFASHIITHHLHTKSKHETAKIISDNFLSLRQLFFDKQEKVLVYVHVILSSTIIGSII